MPLSKLSNYVSSLFGFKDDSLRQFITHSNTITHVLVFQFPFLTDDDISISEETSPKRILNIDVRCTDEHVEAVTEFLTNDKKLDRQLSPFYEKIHRNVGPDVLDTPRHRINRQFVKNRALSSR